MRDEILKFMGRIHSVGSAIDAVACAKGIFDNVSIDMIYAHHFHKAPSCWTDELSKAIETLRVPHMSLYQISYPKGTKIFRQLQEGKFMPLDENEVADLYRSTDIVTERFGLQRYEVSNYSMPGYESEHNKSYWEYRDYIGIGPGAHGRISISEPNNKFRRKFAFQAHLNVEKWKRSIRSIGHGYETITPLSEEQLFCEMLMMGLRMREGISTKKIDEFLKQTTPRESSSEKFSEFWSKVEALHRRGIISMYDHREHKQNLRVSPNSSLLIDEIASFLIF
ncbi:hypothetical protein HYD_3170 [Candidatus Hydrogenosomobacter endosymbioticus]|uniref:Oxygen-independent coproporphyrinogen III oxidase n=2 Tax=Candidatus Hydrogenosomobacter endosymbioticus TaxID=2558174 RepID=A0ABN6L2S0_9PROT|nr:hypothetical protein HYD_3170 [Candidatus Hydrogenosomobacter endosymbioticus]